MGHDWPSKDTVFINSIINTQRIFKDWSSEKFQGYRFLSDFSFPSRDDEASGQGSCTLHLLGPLNCGNDPVRFQLSQRRQVCDSSGRSSKKTDGYPSINMSVLFCVPSFSPRFGVLARQCPLYAGAFSVPQRLVHATLPEPGHRLQRRSGGPLRRVLQPLRQRHAHPSG